jgi:hypothetical protein
MSMGPLRSLREGGFLFHLSVFEEQSPLLARPGLRPLMRRRKSHRSKSLQRVTPGTKQVYSAWEQASDSAYNSVYAESPMPIYSRFPVTSVLAACVGEKPTEILFRCVDTPWSMVCVEVSP